MDRLSEDLVKIVASYANEYELMDWVPIEKLNWIMLSRNPTAINLLEKNLNKIDWQELSRNSAAFHLLEKDQDKIDWQMLSENPAGIHLLEKNPAKIDWDLLSGNSAAIHLLEKNLDKINFIRLLGNKAAEPLIMKHFVHRMWEGPPPSYVLDSHTDCDNLSRKWEGDDRNWCAMSFHPHVINSLKNHPERICWKLLSINPSIFEINYDKILKKLLAI